MGGLKVPPALFLEEHELHLLVAGKPVGYGILGAWSRWKTTKPTPPFKPPRRGDYTYCLSL